jgi:RNA polymerase sigma factor (sigma-70 family)
MTTLANASGVQAEHDVSLTDSELLARVGRGDEGAIASLYDRHSALVYSVALRVCHDSASAEEVVQAIFMEMWLGPQPFASGAGRLDGRLALFARNRAIEALRRGKADVGGGERAARAGSFYPMGHADVSQPRQKPDELGLLLPDQERRMLEMAFFDGMTPVEIAEETGNPVGTVASTLRGALRAQGDRTADAADAEDDTGLEVLDLDSHTEFAARKLNPRDVSWQMEGLRRLTCSFLQNPDAILQELVNAAVDLCGADSAGISVETEEKSDASYYHWVATAGQYNGFLHAVLPRYPSACGICLERGKPQLFRVKQRFFDIMGIEAPLVTDGILLPWQVEETRGTIFIMAHGRAAAFDSDHGQLMRVLADFAAMAVRHQRQQQALLEHATAAAAAAMANKLAHRINNPLQSLLQVAYLAVEGNGGQDTRALGQELTADLQRLSAVVNETLGPPTSAASQE